jgi:ATP-dependent Zn protease
MGTNLPKNFPGGAAATPSTPPSGSALPKNLLASQQAAAAAMAAAPPPRKVPEITRAEIAEHFARRIARLRDEAKGASTRSWLFAVEVQFTDFEREIAGAYAAQAGAAFHAGGFSGAEPSQSLVMLGSSISAHAEIELIVHYMNHGHDVTIFCPRKWTLPDAVTDLVDATLKLPRFTPATFAAACEDFYELAAVPGLGGDLDWVASVVPRDFLLNSAVEADEIVPSLHRSVKRRLARYDVDDAFHLDDFSGMQEVRDWASSVVAEIRLARAGAIPWHEIESRVVLTGGLGVGKTSLTRAIAAAAGIRFVETSAFRWAAAGNPAQGLAMLQADFAEAMRAAPALFFVDDVDVFQMKEGAPLTGMFLQHLEALVDEEPIVFVAGALAASNVSFALRRRGALESTLAMPAPGSQVLARMYERKLKDVPHTLTARELDDIGRLSLGLTGHGLDLIVRRARRIARKDGNRPITKDDMYRVLSRERFGEQSEGQQRLMAEDELRNTAYHEAGHAILQLMRTHGAGLNYASIVPRTDGKLGFVFRVHDESRNSETRNDMLEDLRVCLAGRAAEEVLGGPDSVTTGCSNDLEKATAILGKLLTRSGYNGLLSLRLSFERSPELRAEASRILDAEYAAVLAILRENRALLDRVAALLIEKQEVSGDELNSLYEAWRAGRAN